MIFGVPLQGSCLILNIEMLCLQDLCTQREVKINTLKVPLPRISYTSSIINLSYRRGNFHNKGFRNFKLPAQFIFFKFYPSWKGWNISDYRKYYGEGNRDIGDEMNFLGTNLSCYKSLNKWPLPELAAKTIIQWIV